MGKLEEIRKKIESLEKEAKELKVLKYDVDTSKSIRKTLVYTSKHTKFD